MLLYTVGVDSKETGGTEMKCINCGVSGGLINDRGSHWVCEIAKKHRLPTPPLEVAPEKAYMDKDLAAFFKNANRK